MKKNTNNYSTGFPDIEMDEIEEEVYETNIAIKACSQACVDNDVHCHFKECEYWINYGQDHNCDLISIHKHGQLTLREIGARMGVSYVRIKQIEKAALEKIRSKTTLQILQD